LFAPSALNRENCIFFVHCDAPRVESMTERAEFNSRKFEFEKLSKRLLHTSRWDNNAHIRSTDGRTYIPSWPDYGVLRDNFSSSEGPRPRALRARQRLWTRNTRGVGPALPLSSKHKTRPRWHITSDSRQHGPRCQFPPPPGAPGRASSIQVVPPRFLAPYPEVDETGPLCPLPARRALLGSHPRCVLTLRRRLHRAGGLRRRSRCRRGRGRPFLSFRTLRALLVVGPRLLHARVVFPSGLPARAHRCVSPGARGRRSRRLSRGRQRSDWPGAPVQARAIELRDADCQRVVAPGDLSGRRSDHGAVGAARGDPEGRH
jgi:hypothetical protein